MEKVAGHLDGAYGPNGLGVEEIVVKLEEGVVSEVEIVLVETYNMLHVQEVYAEIYSILNTKVFKYLKLKKFGIYVVQEEVECFEIFMLRKSETKIIRLKRD